MPGLVIDPEQNPTEGRFGYFMDTDDGHIKLYLKLDEDDQVPPSRQSRYFTFHTPVNAYKSYDIPGTVKMEGKDINFNVEIHLVQETIDQKKHPIVHGLGVSSKVLFKGREKKYEKYDPAEIDKIKEKADKIENIKAIIPPYNKQ